MKFTRTHKIVLNVLVLSSLLGTQSALAKPPTEKALLWEISGQGLKQPSYLFGTIHATCSDRLVLSNSLKKALAQSSQLYLEVDLDDPTLMRDSLQGSIMPNGASLKSYLSAQEYTRANQFFRKNISQPLDALSTLKPIILSTLMFPALLNCNPVSWENTLVGLAKAQKKEVLGLETIQEQFKALDRIPAKVQAQQLMQIVDNLPLAKKELSDLLTAYKNQDVDQIRQLIARSPGMKPEYEAALIDNRNFTWIPGMVKAVKTKSTFFGVGAGHLGGKYGVVELLRRTGYRVTPIDPK